MIYLKPTSHLHVMFTTTVLLIGSASLLAAPGPPTPPNLTAGGQRDERSADFNLGPTGARGWVSGWRTASYHSRQILISSVAKDSPADGVLKEGDVILGVNGKVFDKDARRAMGEAIGPAEVTGRLPLRVWRDGKTTDLVLKLQVLGPYSDTWPYNCQKSEMILRRGSDWIAQTKLRGIPGDVNALALLASGDPKHLPMVRDYARQSAPANLDLDFIKARGYPSWGWGYRAVFLAEYYLATGDELVLPALREYAHEIALGQSAVGTWGHRMAEPAVNGGQLHGRLGGYGAVNAAGLPCFVGMVLAQQCGITDDREINAAVERSARFFAFFANRGSIPYGFHDPRMVDHDDNGKNCMGAFAFDMLDRGEETRHFARWALASFDSRELGHTGNFFSYLWGPTGVQRIGDEAVTAFMKEQQWYYDLARDHLGRFHYQGQAGVGPQNYSRWDCTGVYLLAYALPKKVTYFSGKGVRSENVLDRQGIADSILAGRGYTIWDRGHAYYSAKSLDELFEILHTWSPLARQRAAKALAVKGGNHTSRLIAMLRSDNRYAQHGACQAIKAIGQVDSAAIDPLIKLLDSGDQWLRITAAQAIVAIGGKEARKAAPKMLELLTEDNTDDDPLMVETRYLGAALFQKGGRNRSGVNTAGLLSQDLEGVDMDRLLEVVRQILRHPNGGARNSVMSLYATLTPKQLKPVMPEILNSIERPGWSVMFSNGIRENGLTFLAENHVEEGLDQLLLIISPDNPRGEGYWFAPRVIKNLRHYRGAARPYLPKLREFAAVYKSSRALKDNERFHRELQAILDLIENDDNPPALTSWKDL